MDFGQQFYLTSFVSQEQRHSNMLPPFMFICSRVDCYKASVPALVPFCIIQRNTHLAAFSVSSNNAP